jgi:hypothetical protein
MVTNNTGDAGDVRPMSAWDGQLRTVCHRCRGTGQVTVEDDDGGMRLTPVVVPGDGTVTKAVGTSSGLDLLVGEPCPDCGETDTPGWLPGYVVPV